MTRFLVWLFLGVALSFPALACPPETQETRITEALTADDVYIIIEGEDLDLFIKNSNDLYNIGWQRSTISKIYAIESEHKSDNPHFQVVHLFFIDNEGCIAYYQTVYAAVLTLVLADDPQSLLGGRE
jgi:hypothetical protein